MSLNSARSRSASSSTNRSSGPASSQVGRTVGIELAHLRALFREVVTSYVQKREAQIERVAELVQELSRSSTSPSEQTAFLQQLVDQIRELKVKPRKGRRKDVLRLDALIKELAAWADRQPDQA